MTAGRRPDLASPPTAAFAGRLVPEKGVDVLLRAFARVLPGIPAGLVGGQPQPSGVSLAIAAGG